MILNFSVKNYRSINEKITLSFEASKDKELGKYYIRNISNRNILRLAIIYGPNASGKTNILKALNSLRELVLNPPEKRTDRIPQYEPFIFTNESKNTEFEIEFIYKNTRYLYKVEFNNECIINEELYFFSPRKSLIYKRSYNQDSKDTEIKFGSKIKIINQDKQFIKNLTLKNNTVLGAYLKSNLKIEEFNNVIRWFLRKLKPIVYPKTDLTSWVLNNLEKENIEKRAILEILQKADLDIQDFDIKTEDEKIPEFIKNLLKTLEKEIEKEIEKSKPEQLSLKVKRVTPSIVKLDNNGDLKVTKLFFNYSIKNKKYFLPYEEESSGTKRFFQLAALLSKTLEKDLIIPIDEIESSLHPDLIKQFLKIFLFNQSNSQLILTTHYRELLTEKDILRRDTIWFTDKKSDRSTELYSLIDFPTEVLRKDYSIYKAYKSGKLGAVPILKGYTISSLKTNKEREIEEEKTEKES